MFTEISTRRGAGMLIPLFLTVMVVGAGATGTVAAQTTTAPDCSTVAYTQNAEGDFKVNNVSQLQCVGKTSGTSLSDNFTLVSDIDASSTGQWNGGDGFEPIGPSTVNTFVGTFDGAGHTVRGLTINRSTADNVGLFGVVGGRGTVEDVVLDRADMDGSGTVGTLVGRNFGTVNESSANGRVNGSSAVGGLVGYNLLSGAVKNSSASVDTDGNSQVGGLVGQNDGVVENSYARGDTTGTSEVGGLVGFNNFGATVETSYATGKVQGNSPGGLIGLNTLGSVTDSYWDTQSTGQSSSAGGGTGLTTAEMTGSAAASNMQGFDFTTTWKTVTSPDDYPILAWQEEDIGGGGESGSIDNIQTALSDTDGDDLSDQVQVGVTVSNATGKTTVELGESNFDVDVSPTGMGQATFVVLQDTDSDGTPESVEFTSLGTVSTTYTVVADLSNQSDGETGTVDVTLGNAASSTTFTVEESTGSLGPNNPFGDSNNDPVDRRTVINRVVKWNMDGTIGGTSYTRQEIIRFVVQWNLAS